MVRPLMSFFETFLSTHSLCFCLVKHLESSEQYYTIRVRGRNVGNANIGDTPLAGIIFFFCIVARQGMYGQI